MILEKFFKNKKEVPEPEEKEEKTVEVKTETNITHATEIKN